MCLFGVKVLINLSKKVLKQYLKLLEMFSKKVLRNVLFSERKLNKIYHDLDCLSER